MSRSAHAAAPLHSHCQNCETALTGPYCSACGQHDIDYHRSVWHVVEDSLEDLVHFDGRLLRTLRCLFTRPGLLSQEFTAGRRSRYTHPLRLYVFASFLFFLVNSFLPTDAFTWKVNPDPATPSGQIGVQRKGSLPKRITTLFKPEVLTSAEFRHEAMHLLPEALFFCVPILALFLKWAYGRTRHYYVEHFIFALHIQAFFFLTDPVRMLLAHFAQQVSRPLGVLLNGILQIGMMYLIFRAYRVFYRQGRFKTFLKFAGVTFSYFMVVAMAVAGTAALAAILVSREH